MSYSRPRQFCGPTFISLLLIQREIKKEIERRKTGKEMLEYKRRQEEELTKRMLEERNREKAEERAARERIRQQIAMVKFWFWKIACCFSHKGHWCAKKIHFLICWNFERLSLFLLVGMWLSIVTIYMFGAHVAFPVYKIKLLLSYSWWSFLSEWTQRLFCHVAWVQRRVVI